MALSEAAAVAGQADQAPDLRAHEGQPGGALHALEAYILSQPDGGWTVDFTGCSPAARLEWRSYMTVRAVAVLTMNGR